MIKKIFLISIVLLMGGSSFNSKSLIKETKIYGSLYPFGASIAGIALKSGDIDGDGIKDLIIGGQFNTGSGFANLWIIYGKNDFPEEFYLDNIPMRYTYINNFSYFNTDKIIEVPDLNGV